MNFEPFIRKTLLNEKYTVKTSKFKLKPIRNERKN